jgi:hypothetical protein
MAQIQQQQSQHLISAQMATGQALVSVLQQLGTKSKGAAVAAIATNTALQAAAVIQNPAAASTRALAELGPIAGPPVAASIAAWGKVQLALVIGAGALQARGAISGGVPSVRGGGAIPNTVGESNAESQPSRSAHFEIRPGYFSSSETKSLIERINHEVKNGATLITTEIKQ